MRKIKKINGFLVVKFNDREKREYEGTALGEYGVIDAEVYTGNLDIDRGAMEYDDADTLEVAVELARGLESEEDITDEPPTYTAAVETNESYTEEAVEPAALIEGWTRRLATQVKSKHYTESKQYLIDKLKAAGIKSKPFTTEKALEKSQESHIGAVLFERETFTRNGSKKRYRDEEGTLHKRRKIMERATTFGVIIGGYTDDEVEEIFDRFVASLDRGIYIDGNFVPIEIEGADWVDKDDSLLKAQVAVQVMITFNGGVYRDTGFAPLTDVRVTSVEKIT